MRLFENYFKLYPYIEALTDDAPDAEIRWEISDLLRFLEDYLNITTNQYMRVKNKRECLAAYKDNKKLLHREINIMFGDIHFMFVAMGKVYSNALLLLKILGKQELFRSILSSDHYKIVKFFRNNLEHMDEKLTDQNDKYRKSWYSTSSRSHWFSRQWGTMSETEITLGDYTFSIDEQSLFPLWEIYDQILAILNEKYIVPNKEKVDRLFKGHLPSE